MNEPLFSGEEWLRYSRHIQLPKFGAKGQQKLKQSHALVVGAGGLGSPVLLYLAAAGVGKITLFDGDHVDVTNLQRQVIFESKDVGHSKALAAKQRIQALNSHIQIEAVAEFFALENGSAAVEAADIVLDCTDNFATRYLINDLAAQHRKPWVFASIYQFSGQCSLFAPGEICFRCLFPEVATEAPNCNEAGVIGVLPGILGTIQATEAIKHLTGLPTPLKNHLLLFNALDYSSRKIELTQDKNCVICAQHKTPEQLTDFYATVCASEDVYHFDLSAADYKARANEYQLLDVRSNTEHKAFNIGGDHMPLDNIEINSQSAVTVNLRKNKILCYCQTGNRSRRAAKQLRDMGVEAFSLTGGLAEWLKAS